MTQDEVVRLLESSKTPQDWSANCRTVKQAFGGAYPPFWFKTIIQSGLADRVLKAAGYPDGALIRARPY